ncbi:MAG: trigger factor [Tractidigestivibacter sp.]|uniref:trigger factor n=1 Tax=Tractidigestivibacter sp. TaxID=2847320 RepID=UPI003D8F9E0B
MKITVTAEEPQDNKVAAKLTIPAADVDAAIAKTYKDIAHKYNFQGFRRGHAPRPVIDGIIGKESVRAQATNDLLNDAEPLMLDELDIVPIGQVDFGSDVKPAVDDTDYVIDVTINVRPAAELSSYDAPEINMPPEDVTDAEVEQQVKRYLTYQTTYEDLPEDQVAEKGDVVKVDVENVEGAEKLAGNDQSLTLEDDRVPAEVLDALVGTKAGDEKEVAWTVSHGEGDDAHEDSYKAKFTVKGVRRPHVPELTDEYAKKGFGYDTVDAFKDAVRDEIAEDKKVSLPGLKEDRVVEAVGERLTLDEIPENYQNEVFNELGQEVLGQMQRQGISLDMYLQARGIPVDDFIADLHEQAEERARQSLALDAIVRQLGLEATEEDVRSEFEKAGVKDVDASIEQWRSEGRLPAIRDSIKRTKALDWLVENAKVTVVDEAAEAAKADEASDDAEAEAKDSAEE